MDSDIEVSDGARLAYRLYTAPSSRAAEAGQASVLVYFHANAELCTDLETEVNRFFECGFVAVLCPEFRGYAWSTGRPRLGALGPDAEAVIEALPEILGDSIQEPLVIVHGRSLGTVCAVHVAACCGSAVSGLVVESGVVSLLDLPMVQQLGAMMPAMLQMLSAEPDPLGSIEKLRQIQVPTLFVHGDQDEVIPVRQAIDAHRMCASPVKKLVRYFRAHHNDLRDLAGEEYFAELSLLRRVVAGDLPHETFMEQASGSPGVFNALTGALSCLPGIRRCFAGQVAE